MSEGFSRSHNSQLGRFKDVDVASAPSYCHRTISLFTQNPNLSRPSLFGFLDRQGATSQVIAVILTVSDVFETASRKGVIKLRVLNCWRQLVAGQFLLARKPI